MLTDLMIFLRLLVEVIFQLLKCSPDVATTPVVYTSGLEIEFYPNLTPE